MGIYADSAISIHAPTRGATQGSSQRRKEREISIHAPTRGATQMSSLKRLNLRFQSTLPREERRLPSLLLSGLYHDFNPRSHERSDDMYSVNLCCCAYFNPRSHERSDSNIAQKICLFLYNTDNKYIIR